MDGITGSTVVRAVGEFGILGLGWVLFIFMMFREIRERRRYTDLVIHIIEYFTKINMLERNYDGDSFQFDILDSLGTRRGKSQIGRRPRDVNHEAGTNQPPRGGG